MSKVEGILATAVLLAGGCLSASSTPAAGAEPKGSNRFAAIYARATIEFGVANFLKPAPFGTNELIFNLAPMLLEEVKPPRGTNAGAWSFGTLVAPNGTPALDRSRPTIYVGLDTVASRGQNHSRLIYLWFYSAARGALAPQGVRLTLDSTGQPAIWEALADHSGARLFFVSQSLEAAATAQFGAPLPGRRFAIERSAQEAPNSLVARVINDGPLPMGPMVYIGAGRHDIATLICRCMPEQAKIPGRSGTYELKPFQIPVTDRLLLEARARIHVPLAFWPSDNESTNHPETFLRLPAKW